jgi:hypothetical protein
MRETFGQGIGELVTKHNDELQTAGQPFATRRFASQRERNAPLSLIILTAMSGLSANTYSCAGDGDRLRGGGEGSRFGMASPFGTLWKNFRIPFSGFNWMSDSSSDGAGESEEREDSSEESSSAILGDSTNCRSSAHFLWLCS